MYRFLLRPKWVLGHVLVLVTVVLFVNLGFWQLRRADERAAFNELLTERQAQTPIGLDDVIAADDDPTDLAFRRIELSGTYRADEEVLLSTRSHQGVPGHHVLTPLEVAHGWGVIVDRGWVPLDTGDLPVTAAPPPPGEVTVRGVVLLGRAADRFGPADADRLRFVSDVDTGRLASQIDVPLLDLYVLAAEHTPTQPASYPLAVEPPPPEPGNHLSYAAQWFIFATIAAVGYPLLVRRTARDPEPDADLGGDRRGEAVSAGR